MTGRELVAALADAFIEHGSQSEEYAKAQDALYEWKREQERDECEGMCGV